MDYSVFVWPLAAVLSIVIAIVVLRAPITRFIDRSNRWKIWPAEIEASDSPHQQLPHKRPPGDLIESALVPYSVVEHPLYSQLDRDVGEALSSKYPGNSGAQLAQAIRLATTNYTEKLHQANYREIFGSQIDFPKHINIRGVADREDAQPFYDEGAASLPDFYSTYTIDRWIGFLQKAGLTEAVEGGTQITLTPAGRDFLEYLIRARLPENRPG
jgi:hypothetical protein